MLKSPCKNKLRERKMKNYSVSFYSRNRNILLAKEIKDILENKNYGVLNVDNLDEFFIHRNASIRHIILDLLTSELDERSCSLIKLMLKSNLIDSVIMLVPYGKTYGSDFMYVYYGESFRSDFEIMFNKVLEKQSTKEMLLSNVWRSEISKCLCGWGFSSKCNGFSMLIDTIIYYVQKKCIVKKLSREAYVLLAHKYSVTPACVELCIRKSIHNANKNVNKFPQGCAVTNKGFIVYSVSQLYDFLTTLKC